MYYDLKRVNASIDGYRGITLLVELEILKPLELAGYFENAEIWGTISTRSPLTVLPKSLGASAHEDWFESYSNSEEYKKLRRKLGEGFLAVELRIRDLRDSVTELLCVLQDAESLSLTLRRKGMLVTKPIVELGTDFLSRRPWVLYGHRDRACLFDRDEAEAWLTRERRLPDS